MRSGHGLSSGSSGPANLYRLGRRSFSRMVEVPQSARASSLQCDAGRGDSLPAIQAVSEGRLGALPPAGADCPLPAAAAAEETRGRYRYRALTPARLCVVRAEARAILRFGDYVAGRGFLLAYCRERRITGVISERSRKRSVRRRFPSDHRIVLPVQTRRSSGSPRRERRKRRRALASTKGAEISHNNT